MCRQSLSHAAHDSSLYTKEPPLSLPFDKKGRGIPHNQPPCADGRKTIKTSPPCAKGGREGGIVCGRMPAPTACAVKRETAVSLPAGFLLRAPPCTRKGHRPLTLFQGSVLVSCLYKSAKTYNKPLVQMGQGCGYRCLIACAARGSSFGRIIDKKP